MGNKNSGRPGQLPNDGSIEYMENSLPAQYNCQGFGVSSRELFRDRIMSDLEQSNYFCGPQTLAPDNRSTLNSNDCNISNCQSPLSSSIQSSCPPELLNSQKYSDYWGEKRGTVECSTVRLPDRKENTSSDDSSDGSSGFNEIVDKKSKHKKSKKHKKHRNYEKKRKHKHKHKKHKHRHRRSILSSSSSSSVSLSSESLSSEGDGMHFLKVETKKTAPKKEIKVADNILGFSYEEDGSCTYTAYIQCNNSAEWDKFLGKTARCMTGLQRQFNVTIKFSDGILYHRGNSVRLFHINGIHKGFVIRCKAALPKIMLNKLITPVNGIEEVQAYAKERTYARLALSRPNLCKFATKSMNNILNQ